MPSEMRNGGRCRWCFEMARPCILTTCCSCHLSHVSHRVARCPLLMSRVSSYSYPPAVQPWGVCLRRVSYSISFVSVLSLFAFHLCVTLLLYKRSCIFLISISLNVSVSPLSHVYSSKAGLKQNWTKCCDSSPYTSLLIP